MLASLVAFRCRFDPARSAPTVMRLMRRWGQGWERRVALPAAAHLVPAQGVIYLDEATPPWATGTRTVADSWRRVWPAHHRQLATHPPAHYRRRSSTGLDFGIPLDAGSVLEGLRRLSEGYPTVKGVLFDGEDKFAPSTAWRSTARCSREEKGRLWCDRPGRWFVRVLVEPPPRSHRGPRVDSAAPGAGTRP